MAINEHEVLMLLKSGKHYLLLNAGDRLHLVNVNDRLTEEKENQLLAMYPCSESALSVLGISYTTIHKKDLKGVAVGGVDAGCELSLLMGKTKSKYALSDDTMQEVMDDYFKGVRRMDASKRKLPKSPDQWRKEAQDPEILKKMKIVRSVMIAAMVIFDACFLFRVAPYKLWIVLCMLCSAACLVLAIKYPAYFTLLDLEDKKHKPKYGIGLGWISTFPLMLLTVRTLYMNVIQLGRLLVYAAILTVMLAIVLWIFVKELHNHSAGFAAVILALLFGSIGIVGQMNYLLDTSTEEIAVYTVLDLDRHSTRRSQWYRCTITLEDGKEYRMDISREAYKSLTVGDQIQVAHREGGLGLEYIYLVED